jgi:hypothetical protein
VSHAQPAVYGMLPCIQFVQAPMPAGVCLLSKAMFCFFNASGDTEHPKCCLNGLLWSHRSGAGQGHPQPGFPPGLMCPSAWQVVGGHPPVCLPSWHLTPVAACQPDLHQGLSWFSIRDCISLHCYSFVSCCAACRAETCVNHWSRICVTTRQ